MPLPYWAGFLSGYPGLPHNELHQSWQQRFWFGVQLWLEAPISVKVLNYYCSRSTILLVCH
jgi:lycopene beta-cyclase